MSKFSDKVNRIEIFMRFNNITREEARNIVEKHDKMILQRKKKHKKSNIPKVQKRRYNDPVFMEQARTLVKIIFESEKEMSSKEKDMEEKLLSYFTTKH